LGSLLLLASLARSGAQSFSATNATLSLVVVVHSLVSASLHEPASLVPPLADSAGPLVDVEVLSAIRRFKFSGKSGSTKSP